MSEPNFRFDMGAEVYDVRQSPIQRGVVIKRLYIEEEGEELRIEYIIKKHGQLIKEKYLGTRTEAMRVFDKRQRELAQELFGS